MIGLVDLKPALIVYREVVAHRSLKTAWRDQNAIPAPKLPKTEIKFVWEKEMKRKLYLSRSIWVSITRQSNIPCTIVIPLSETYG